MKYTLTFLFFFCAANVGLLAQCEVLVWEDHFDGTALDAEYWSYRTGPGFNPDELQYFTDLPTNVAVNGGTLKLIAQDEMMNGFDYTSGAVWTRDKIHWRYGRVEGRMKLPAGQGFWPAFWLMPDLSRHGQWPTSGEMDIMEYLGHETSRSYATAHYGNSVFEAYDSHQPYDHPTGDFSTDFHVFAFEWEPDTLRWYVDGVPVHLFTSSMAIPGQVFPYDEAYHIIMNLSVGGSWPGNPNSSTPFPSEVEVDYVKVYQRLYDASIYGPAYLQPFAQGVTYSAPEIAGATYNWVLPAGFSLVSGQGTNEISVNATAASGTIELEIEVAGCGTESVFYEVKTDYNWCKNGDFENRFENWEQYISHGDNAYYIEETGVHQGDFAGCLWVGNVPPNWWEDQLLFRHTGIVENTDYTLTFWAKSHTTDQTINVSFLDTENFDSFSSTDIDLDDVWTEYTIEFTSPASFNNVGIFFSCGFQSGIYCFDDLRLVSPNATPSIMVEPSCIQLFPNPSSDFVTLDGDFTDYDLKIFDAVGSLVQDLTGSSAPVQIDLAGLGAGLFFLEVTNQSNNEVSVYKIIKED